MIDKASQLAKAESQTSWPPKPQEPSCSCYKSAQEGQWIWTCPNVCKLPGPCLRCHWEEHWSIYCPHAVRNMDIKPGPPFNQILWSGNRRWMWPDLPWPDHWHFWQEASSSHHSIREIHLLPPRWWGHFFSPYKIGDPYYSLIPLLSE